MKGRKSPVWLFFLPWWQRPIREWGNRIKTFYRFSAASQVNTYSSSSAGHKLAILSHSLYWSLVINFDGDNAVGTGGWGGGGGGGEKMRSRWESMWVLDDDPPWEIQPSSAHPNSLTLCLFCQIFTHWGQRRHSTERSKERQKEKELVTRNREEGGLVQMVLGRGLKAGGKSVTSPLHKYCLLPPNLSSHTLRSKVFHKIDFQRNR